jgi:hypothetical protein
MKANHLFIACVAALSLAACGGGTEFNATLSGAAEKPTAVTTSASGTAKVTIDGTKVKVEGTYTGLSGNAMAAHIHGPADENSVADIFCNLKADTATSGTLSEAGTATSKPACSTVELTDAQIKDFEDGRMYINIHTAANQAGEIRGQIKK